MGGHVTAFSTQCPAIFPEPPVGGGRCLPHLHLGVSRRGPDCESCALPGTTPPPSPSIPLHRFRESTCDHWHSFGGWEIVAEVISLSPQGKALGGEDGESGRGESQKREESGSGEGRPSL